ncbi:MaoC/PaaZ C-terminal domain-containing protein [Bradyrhizobium sp. CCBAU 51627]|uniref:MaoC/PaaZ C-terminal domain-containing protein n=1 Tax=Bradyrhizobium sp. CCBAU 51627 TaxID=1325088 RepID=UPI00230545EE|nr:MaoC/PaaZ C-terminal domain-containing protein [Bradyrhizobium sp. CCBAU 51627]
MHLEVTDETPPRALLIDDLSVGDRVVQKVVFDTEKHKAFACLARDSAPVHDDVDFARRRGFDAPIIQGLAVVSRFSRLMGMYLPGEHAVLQRTEFKFHQPVYADKELLYSCEVKRIVKPLRVVLLAVAVTADGIDRVTGQCQCQII